MNFQSPLLSAPESGPPRGHDALHSAITAWFEASARVLPWRSADRTPWGVYVSEVMLQQTPVVRVLPVWTDWLARWPTPAHLAAEPAGEAVRHWGRLGYPRRALRLHAAATAMVDLHEGAVPSDYDTLLTLPGVGGYTAAAVAAFAFGARETVVDTNIRRVHARLVGGKALPAPALTAAEMRRAALLLPEEDALSVQWNAAVMELGAVVCTARSPRCEACPVLESCAWVAAGRPEPDYVPRGQAWAGTDRQVRGAILAVLREAEDYLVPELLVSGPVDLSPPSDNSRLTALDTLHRLRAPAQQVERALAGLLADGLAQETTGGIGLPR
ncbi:A/G-specific adenine glycosylase [Arthrobacter sp. Br18]|uniref:A/G-specific adenine glycosylase n=1 Tax=Arthrobacter sp. Br18 TaxID=1312954 RepID=UPI0009DF4D20|nr:A/G-specific adenine glycosylase [Arthrobacter sp. Br18]